jgi:hypothetical protein
VKLRKIIAIGIMVILTAVTLSGCLRTTTLNATHNETNALMNSTINAARNETNALMNSTINATRNETNAILKLTPTITPT